jgi:hypothetical protein
MEDVLLDACRPRALVFESKERLGEYYGDVTAFYDRLRENLTRVGDKHLGEQFQFPPAPVLGSVIAAKPFREAKQAVDATVGQLAAAVHDELVRHKLGTVEWGEDGESARFTFQEVVQRKGLLRHVVHRTPHTHLVVRARIRPLDDRDVKLPAGAQAIVADLLPELRRELRVVVGAEIVRETGAEEVRKEWTPLAKGAARFGKIAGSVAAAAGLGAAAVGAASLLGAAAATVGTAAVATVFVADPALVLGDVCLFGWEE